MAPKTDCLLVFVHPHAKRVMSLMTSETRLVVDALINTMTFSKTIETQVIGLDKKSRRSGTVFFLKS